jgi:glycosyltransferase involved in cell wall biosynthesis
MKIILNGSIARSLVNFRGPLLQEMLRRGHIVHVSAPDIGADIHQQLEALGVIVHQVPLNRTGQKLGGDLAYFRAMRRLIKNVQPDLVVGYTIKPNIWGSLAAGLSGIGSASMVTGLGYTFIETGGWKRQLIATLSRWLYALATKKNFAVIFQNPDDVRDFVAAGCLANADKASVVSGSGVDLAHFRAEPLPTDARFLMIGRLLGNKGVREYAAASIALKRTYPDWTFDLVGSLDPGPDCIEQEELTNWIEDGAITYHGQTNDVRPYLANCSIYVLPSYREGTPRSVLEAMATGRAIVTSDAPGCRETVVEGYNGLLVPAADSNALARAMATLGEDKFLRSSMAQRSRSIAENRYAAEKVAASVCNILGL